MTVPTSEVEAGADGVVVVDDVVVDEVGVVEVGLVEVVVVEVVVVEVVVVEVAGAVGAGELPGMSGLVDGVDTGEPEATGPVGWPAVTGAGLLLFAGVEAFVWCAGAVRLRAACAARRRAWCGL